jgi:hypothetical protein
MVSVQWTLYMMHDAGVVVAVAAAAGKDKGKLGARKGARMSVWRLGDGLEKMENIDGPAGGPSPLH